MDASHLVGPGFVLTPSGVLPLGGVLVEARRIARIAPFAELAEAHPDALVLDAGEHGIILPGLVDAFAHATAPLWRCYEPSDGTLPRTPQQWEELVRAPLERQLTLEDVALAAKLMFAEAARAGITSLLVHHASPAALAGSLDALAEAAQTLGVRAWLGYALDERDGVEQARAALAEAQRFAAARTDSDGLVGSCFALAAPHAVGAETTQRLRTLGFVADEVGGLLAPLAVDGRDHDHARREESGGASLLDWLEAQGLLTPHLIAVGGCELSDAELSRLATVGAALVHTPRANRSRGARRARLEAFSATSPSLVVGLGSAGHKPDMFAELREAAAQLRDTYGGITTGIDEAFAALFTGNPTLLARLHKDPPGALVEGAPADVVVLEPEVRLDADAVPGYLVNHAEANHVRHTVCAGSVVVEERTVKTLDEPALREAAAKRLVELWQPALG